MSRNKDVKFVHKITGLPYSECRRRLKESDWDVWEATKIADASFLNDFAEAIGNAVNTICDAFEILVSSVLSIDWVKVAETFAKMTQEVADDN